MFQFRLQPLLNYRQLEEDRLQRELAGIYTQRESAQAVLADLQTSRAKTFARFQQRQREGLSAPELKQYDCYLSAVDNDIRRQQRRIEDIRRQYKEKLAELLEAVKKRKMLDKLKEGQAYREAERLRLAERNFLDEVATTTFNRRRRCNE